MRRDAFVLLLAAMLTAARALRAPVDYAMGSWLVGYQEGLVKRGLVPTLVHPLFAWKSPAEVRFVIATASLLLLVTLFAAVAIAVSSLAAKTSDPRARWSLRACGLAVVTSAWIVMAAHLNGYLDHVVELLALACVWLASTRARWVIALLAPVAVLTHELSLVYGLPMVAIALALDAQGKVARLALLVPVLVAASALWWHVPTEAQIDALQHDVGSYGILGPTSSDNAVYHLRHSLEENVASQRLGMLERIRRTDVGLVVAPPVLLVAGWSLVELWRARRRAIAVLAVPALLAPLALHAVAWDTPRFTTMLVFQAFLLLVAVARTLPMRGSNAVSFLGVLVALSTLFTTVPLVATDVDRDGAFMYRRGPTIRSFEGCRPAFANAGFERGTLAQWTAEGDAFTLREATGIRGSRLLAGTSGGWWAGSYGEDGSGDAREGTLTSEGFDITGPTLLGAIGGGFDRDTVRAALIVDGAEVASATGRNRDVLRPIAWDVRAYVGRLARIVLTDRSSDRWGHLNVDGFCFFR